MSDQFCLANATDLKGAKLVVVLGMHRSGTSTITRALETMGVSLGKKLTAPMMGINEKGFWEDNDIVGLNDKMLGACGKSWSCVEPISESDFCHLLRHGYLDQALQVLTGKLSTFRLYGFKDPRTAKLMPFWAQAFNALRLDVRYILCLRNPVSVAKSLESRDGLYPHSISHYLWLDHTLTSLASTSDKIVGVVRYDNLIDKPDQEIEKIAKLVGERVDYSLLAEFKNGFIDHRLRHARFSDADICDDRSIPDLAKEVYGFLVNVADSGGDLRCALDSGRLKAWNNELYRCKPLLQLADSLLQRTRTDATYAKSKAEVVALRLVRIAGSKTRLLKKSLRLMHGMFK